MNNSIGVDTQVTVSVTNDTWMKLGVSCIIIFVSFFIIKRIMN